MLGVIMAGGEGTRLRPLTCGISKPMVPVLGRPVMEYSIDLLKKHGVKNACVTLAYLPSSVIDHFGDGTDFGVGIDYFIENKPLGTA
ncbi:MAG TPA: sugar phosphate nucleotidyltransferase, partial [Clostridia bacterium]|nr:sugar phosphate nucleotidyltransferase [Clostridia bacterium]